MDVTTPNDFKIKEYRKPKDPIPFLLEAMHTLIYHGYGSVYWDTKVCKIVGKFMVMLTIKWF